MRLSAGRSTFAIITPVAAKIGGSTSDCRNEQRYEEPLLVRARIAKLHSTSHAKTHGHRIPYLRSPLVCTPTMASTSESKITAVVLGWVEDSVVRSDSPDSG